MKSSIVAAVWVTMSLVFAAPASSVDIRNADKDTYEISIIKDNGESESFELAPGRRVSDVCAARCLV